MHFLTTIAAASIAVFLSACSTNPKHQEATLAGVAGSDAKDAEQLVGTWVSEQDGAVFTISEAGLFGLDRGAVRSLGMWRLHADPAGSRLSLINVHESAACPDQEGMYVVEITRDTMRLAIVKDACTGREELMSWPWTRKPTDTKSADAAK